MGQKRSAKWVKRKSALTKALVMEEQRLIDILQQMLTPMDRLTLDGLFDDVDGLYAITLLKRQPKDFSLGEMRREISRGEQLSPLYQLATWIVPQLEISNEGRSYYASLVSYYSVFRLRQLDAWTVYLYLLCFIIHRYQRLNDNLLSCFIHLVKQYGDEAKSAAKEQVYEYRLRSNQAMPKAGEVLKLFTTKHPPDTAFSTIQTKAFTILERQRLERVADYIASEASFDEIAFQWAHIDTMGRRFKQHLRPLIRAVPLAALRVTAPLLEAIEFMGTTFESNHSLRQIDSEDFPTRCIPARDKRYLYERDPTGRKQIIPDRYEFLVYRLLRNGLEAGDLFCRHSVRFRSFEDDLLDDQQWTNKDALIAETGRPILAQSIQKHLADLERQLEERIVAVNQRIAQGENHHFQIKQNGKRKGWTLQYPTSTEPINHPVFATLRQITIRTLLHFVNDHCQFLACFEHVLGRYHKQVADNRVIIACLIAWGTNMGLGRMGEISDISFDALNLTSENFLRLETLKAANECVSNAIASLAIFRQYALGGWCIPAAMDKSLRRPSPA